MGKVTLPRGFDPQVRRHRYLVASRTEAVLYEGLPEKDFRFVKRLRNPKGKLTELELVADRPGRSFSSSRSGIRHGLEPRSLYHDEVAAQFARRIAKLLDKDALDEGFSDLVVVAEPRFLGILNREFSRRVKALVRREVPREWAQGSDRDLEEYLRQKLA